MINLQDFIRTTDLYKKFEVDSLLFVEFKCPYDYSKSGIWWHNNFFAFVLGGQTLMKTPQGEYVLKAGDCIFAKKGCVLTISQTQEDFCELLIFIPDDFIKTVIEKYQVPLATESCIAKADTIIPLLNDESLLIYLQSLLNYFSMSAPPPGTLLKLKFEELVMNIISGNRHPQLRSYFDELCSRTKPSIKEIMEANFFSNLSLNEFARLCSRSLSTYKREFSELYHSTPGKWLIEKRLEYSKYLLETTLLSIDEVCVESGFQNRSHFIKVFKNKYGVTPGKLNMRQNLQHQ